MPSLIVILATALIALNVLVLSSELFFTRATREAMHPGVVEESTFSMLIGLALLVMHL